MAAIRQASFGAGELCGAMLGRTDSPKYAAGAALVRNFFVSKHGALVSRAGTEYLGTASAGVVNIGSAQTPNNVVGGAKVRLIPFYYSDIATSSNYVMEFGARYVRFWKNGAAVTSVAGLPYNPTDLANLRYVQSGDVVYLACAGYPAATISRTAPDTFVYATLTFARPSPDASLVPAYDLNSGSNLGTVDPSHPTRQWSWVVTEVTKNAATGLLTESLPVQLTHTFDTNGTYNNPGGNVLTIALYPDRTARLRMSTAGQAGVSSSFQFFRIYRGRSGVYGWVGDTDWAYFTDDGSAPDFSQQPPQGLNPFEVRDPMTQVLTRTEYPTSVAFYEDRLVFVGTTERPNYLFASRNADYTNFDQRLLPIDDESLVFALSGRRRELAMAAVGRERLFVLTSSAVWVCGGTNGEPLGPRSIEAHPHVDVGSSGVAPLPIDNGLIWVRNKGTGVRRLAYDYRVARFSSVDMSVAAEHLFLGHTIVDWCYAEDPWAQVWAVRDDGMLLSMAYSHDDDIYGWARHDIHGPDNGTTNATVQSVCSIPEGDEDVVYLAVTDAVNTNAAWMLRMATRQITTTKYPRCLDSYTKFGNVSSAGPTTVFNIGTRFGAQQVWAAVDPGYGTPVLSGPYTVSGGNVTVTTGNLAAATVYIGLAYNCEFSSLDLAEGRTRQKVVNDVGLELADLPTGATISAGESASTLYPHKMTQTDIDMLRVPISGSWNTGGQVFVRQSTPAPVTIRGLTREVDAGHG